MTEGKVIKLTADEITETHGDTVFQFVTKALETQDEFIFETIRPFCETQAHMAITKDELISALTLLREQEPVGVEKGIGYLYCGGCKTALAPLDWPKPWKFCPWCGRRVRWEEDDGK